jgi:hypothetical protein
MMLTAPDWLDCECCQRLCATVAEGFFFVYHGETVCQDCRELS